MNTEKVVFSFFIVLALILNFGFFIGGVDNPAHHNVYELFAAIVVNLIATVLKFGDRTQTGAVLLALDHEKQAYGFYSRVAAQTSDSEVRRLARQFADEELQHVAWLEEWRDKCGPDDEKPLDDPDPPLSQE